MSDPRRKYEGRGRGWESCVLRELFLFYDDRSRGGIGMGDACFLAQVLDCLTTRQ